jgi:hypothetical protein
MKRNVKRHAVVQPLDQSIRLIPLTQGQNATVDAADYDWLMQWNWFAKLCKSSGTFYAQRWSGNGGHAWMHREILRLKPGRIPEVDHVNPNDPLNNRRSNLRIATHAQNTQNARKRKDNQAGEKGIYLNRKLNKWMSAISVNGKRIYLGVFVTLEEAISVRREAAIKYHQEFAYVSHLPVSPPDI